MAMRKDPMAAAAEAINAIERICKGQPPADSTVAAAANTTTSSSSSSSSTSSGSGSSTAGATLDVEGQALVCTVGRLDVHPNQVGDEVLSKQLSRLLTEVQRRYFVDVCYLSRTGLGSTSLATQLILCEE